MQTTIELREYILPLLRWWWLLLASVAVATLSSAAFTLAQPALYQSRATIMIGAAIDNPNPSGNEFWLGQQLANTYADLAKRQSVREATQVALGLTWLPGYTINIVPNTQLMELSVIDTDPARAQAVANELVNQLILRSPAGKTELDRQVFVEQELDELQASIRETKDEIARRQSELANMFSARQIADAQNQVAALQSKLATLQSNYTALLATTQRGAANTITVIEQANLPEAPLSSKLGVNVLMAMAIGFTLAAGGAYLLEYLDDSIKNSDDVRKITELSTLGAAPVLDPEETKGSELVMFTNSQSPAAESYRVLRTNLQFASVDRPLHVLLVTSPGPGEGKSLTVANLGIALAQIGKRVVILDTDMHRPRQHRLFNLVNNVGVTTALLGDPTALSNCLQPTMVPRLSVLTTGPLPPNPAELLGSQRMQELLNALHQIADMVIMDSPPVTAVADTAVLSTLADGALLVFFAGKTRRETARRAMGALRQVNARVVGAMLNRMPLRGSGYYYYHYYYHYQYHHRYYRRDDSPARAATQVTSPGLSFRERLFGKNGAPTPGHKNTLPRPERDRQPRS
jgi:non-specific protein-tyrosine kinase